ncbi:MAG: GIY-YIG nuclease family protein [Arenimonas sp.]
MPEARQLLATLDVYGFLEGDQRVTPLDEVDSMDDEALLAELGATDGDDITVLKHVSSYEAKRAAEEIANRTSCADFDQFKPLFLQVEEDLKSGIRQTRLFGRNASIEKGDFFIVGGQLVYVAEMGELFRTPNGQSDARLRVIYSNGTESNLLLRSLQRALYKDETGRRLVKSNSGPMFSDEWEADDIESGTIYVLRSNSTHPYVTEHRELIHKVGVTGGKVQTRIADAVNDPTYLLAQVEIVATYKLSGLNRTKLENVFHRIFAAAQLDLTIQDRFGHPVRPREWFLVPLHVIDEAVHRIRDGSITSYIYDPSTASLVLQAR